ncbi:hypothetical protein [Flavobacterium sp. DG2-3]|uniref:hypothetical protein n=1 Tax=Flavobacterium sp. DG2-3 TaxID=3068317 RepID=UPI00273E4141|nr:hypothetical protein [Flavobacterium sp. DG2-3]MDP5202383.1 hypothetical protein [Flavobacterium sp. DG2-3]
MKNFRIYDLYTPFRNKLRRVNTFDSLYVFWAFSRNFSFGNPLPENIDIPAGYQFNADINSRRHFGMPEQEIEFLIKEVIIHGSNLNTKTSLRQKSELAKVVNYLRFKLKEEISKMTVSEKTEDFLFEFNRMAHNQFLWQLGHNNNIIFRYFKIYSDIKVKKLVEEKFDLTVFQIFLIGFALFVVTGKNFRTKYPYLSHVDVISTEMIQKFFNHFSMSYEEAQKQLLENQKINENLLYTYNPLRAKPILIFEETFLCPIPLLIFWQFTSGLYYSIVNEKNFQNAFGNAFEKYIGEVLSKAVTRTDIYILPEAQYGKGKKTTDWILADNNTIVFFECKSKRMTMASKTEADIQVSLVNDIRHMAKFVVQVYKTYIDFKNGLYPHISYEATQRFIPIVLTLENWFININPRIMQMLNNFVLEIFDLENIDKTLLDKFPYQIISTDDFENHIQLINHFGLTYYFDKRTKNELVELTQNFKFDIVFGDEFESTFLEPLKLATDKTQ